MAYILADLRFESLADQTLTLRLAPEARDRLAFMQGQIPRLAEWLGRKLGRRFRVVIQPPAEADAQPQSPERAAGSRRPGATQQEKDEALRQPLTRQIADLFGARVIDVRREPDPRPNDREQT